MREVNKKIIRYSKKILFGTFITQLFAMICIMLTIYLIAKQSRSNDILYFIFALTIIFILMFILQNIKLISSKPSVISGTIQKVILRRSHLGGSSTYNRVKINIDRVQKIYSEKLIDAPKPRKSILHISNRLVEILNEGEKDSYVIAPNNLLFAKLSEIKNSTEKKLELNFTTLIPGASLLLIWFGVILYFLYT